MDFLLNMLLIGLIVAIAGFIIIKRLKKKADQKA